MIKIIDGLQGSGKSYFAADYIWSNRKEYHTIYTNIDGFKFQDNIIEYKDSEFLEIIGTAKTIYDDENTSDADILQYLYEINFLNAPDKENIKSNLVVIDEVHNQLADKSPLWTWFITYHRHLFIDAVFITQDTNLINYIYRSLFQEIYRAIPASKILLRRKSFKYQKHLKLPIRDGKGGTFVENLFLSQKQEIFDLYHSGDAVRSKSVFVRYYWIIAVALVLAVVLFYKVYSSLTSKGVTSDNENIITSSSSVVSRPIYKKTQQRNTIKISQSKYLALTCVSTVCRNRQYDINLQLDDIKDLLKDTDSKFLRSSRLGKNLSTIYLLASPTFLGLFKKRSYKNEKGFSLMP